MRALTSTLGLVMFLALSNPTFGQFNSKEYLMSISDLVNKKVLSSPYTVNPLQKLYFVNLLPPDYLWRDIATMIQPKNDTGYEGHWSFVDDLNTIVGKIRWSDEPIIEPVKIPTAAPLNTTVKYSPSAYLTPMYMTPVAIKEPAEVSKPAEKKNTVLPVKAAVTVNNKNEARPAEVVTEDELVVPSDLEGVISDDYIEYGSIGFFANAAVIHPSYKEEMASLAAHLKADSSLQLIIHGHCNGTAPRTIITSGLLTRFFEIDTYHEQKTASAKEFTEMRAEYAKRYLVAQGIVPERIQIIGEGGEMMIYPSTSDQSRYNDRIEFELTRPDADLD